MTIRAFLVALALVFSVVLPAAATATATEAVTPEGKFPAAVVAVVDIQKILQDSTAAKNVREQLATRRDGFQKEVTADEQKLRDAEKALLQDRAKLSEADFTKKRQEFEEKVKTVQKKVQERGRQLDAAFNESLATIRKNLGQIVAQAAQQRGVTLVLDKGQVVVVESSFDITALVLEELNKKLPKLAVK